jgi:phosphate starvation-inducible PhoH-like protein
LSFNDNNALREVAGELGAHLKLLEHHLGVNVHQRGSTLMVASSSEDAGADACRILNQLFHLALGGRRLNATDVQHSIAILRADPQADLNAYFDDVILLGVNNKPITPRSPGQRDYYRALERYDITFGVGPAGTGKTYVGMAVAVAALKSGKVRKIILTRPAVEAGEKLGFLPGDLNDKVDPYLRPLFDALEDMVPKDRLERMYERGAIEIAPLAFMRGRTLDDAYVVLDEAQNTTRAQMKMFLTRLGVNGKMVVTGDISQIDLPRREDSGLVQALRVVDGLDAIGVIRLNRSDVVRHPLVSDIIQAYENIDSRDGT